MVLTARDGLADLGRVSRRPLVEAQPGAAGAGGRKEGRRGADATLEVPPGTLAYDAETGALLADLGRPGETAIIARGGNGGGGNIHRASSINRTPTSAGPGEPGEDRLLRLELHLPIDVALVGPPNAGKSTLLSGLTKARPKIADYPHTTTQPELGVMFAEPSGPVTICEIPDSGYLRHLDRARVIALVIDGSSPDPAAVQARLEAQIEAELGRTAAPGAPARPQLVIHTKLDLARSGSGSKRRSKGVLAVSAETGVGLDELRRALLEAVREAPVPARAGPAPHRVLLRPARGAAITVTRRESVLEVSGARIERLLDRYDLATPAGFDRFQVALDRMGVSAALAEAGADAGDTVRIGEAEFEYQP